MTAQCRGPGGRRVSAKRKPFSLPCDAAFRLLRKSGRRGLPFIGGLLAVVTAGMAMSAAVGQEALSLWEPVDPFRVAMALADPVELGPDEPAGLQPPACCDLPAVPAASGCVSVQQCGGFVGGAEVIFFKPFGEAGQSAQQVVTLSGADSFLPAWRLWGGWSDAEGLGFRVRWWQYDQFSSTPSGFGFDFSSRLIFQKLDVEATQAVSYRSWDLLYSGGVTWIGNEMQLGASSIADIDRWRLDAAGVTVGLQGIRRSRAFEHWRWQGGAQFSGVFGNALSQTISDPIGDQPSSLGAILEFTVGPRWERSIGGGATAFAGGNAEAQYWMTGLGSVEDGVTPDGQGPLGLVGLSFNLGIRR